MDRSAGNTPARLLPHCGTQIRPHCLQKRGLWRRDCCEPNVPPVLRRGRTWQGQIL